MQNKSCQLLVLEYLFSWRKEGWLEDTLISVEGGLQIITHREAPFPWTVLLSALLRNHTCHIDKLHFYEQPPHDSSVPLSFLPQNHTYHINTLHPCEQHPHDSSVPSSLLLWNRTRHIDNLDFCEQAPHVTGMDIINVTSVISWQ